MRGETVVVLNVGWVNLNDGDKCGIMEVGVDTRCLIKSFIKAGLYPEDIPEVDVGIDIGTGGSVGAIVGLADKPPNKFGCAFDNEPDLKWGSIVEKPEYTVSGFETKPEGVFSLGVTCEHSLDKVNGGVEDVTIMGAWVHNDNLIK